MPCEFCAASVDLVPCAWRVPRFVTDKVANIDVGDRIANYHGRGPSFVIVSVERSVHGSGTAVTLRARATGGKLVDVGTFLDYAIQVERPRPCGILVCEAHVRMVGDGVGYCKSHWEAWEQVA